MSNLLYIHIPSQWDSWIVPRSCRNVCMSRTQLWAFAYIFNLNSTIFFKQSDNEMDITCKVRLRWAIFLESPQFCVGSTKVTCTFLLQSNFICNLCTHRARQRPPQYMFQGPHNIEALSLSPLSPCKGSISNGYVLIVLNSIGTSFWLLGSKEREEKRGGKGPMPFLFLG